MDTLSRYAPQALAVLRIVTALLFIEHGTAKLFGFPAAMGGGAGEGLPPLMLIGGILEAFGGLAPGIVHASCGLRLVRRDGCRLLDDARAGRRLLPPGE